jgi:hypothetical protein
VIAVIRPVATLLLGLCAVVCIVVGLDYLSGEVTQIEHNRRLDVEVDAYFYTEVGDPEEFLDNSNGRYGQEGVSHTPAY